MLNFCKIRGTLHLGRSDLGNVKPNLDPEEGSQGHHKLVTKTHREIEEEHKLKRALQLPLQCHWVQWEGYIQNNFTWETTLAMPPNLLFFCFGATYDVLPSPKNLKRWHLASESRCFLCHKDVCTIPHILGACKISLQLGRFTFRHDSVLQHLVLVLKSVLKNLPVNTTKKCNTIKFVKSGTKCSKTKIASKGILHLASDWILLADVKGDYLFPFQLALTELHPDILLFSKSSKRAVLLELTCPCEENMENWHSQKLNKYTPLAKVIEKNGWVVDLFAIEVGARGYSSKSLPICLKRLGFNNKIVQKTTKSLSCISMKASFYIWLARNSSGWSSKTSLITIEDTVLSAAGSKNTNTSRGR